MADLKVALSSPAAQKILNFRFLGVFYWNFRQNRMLAPVPPPNLAPGGLESLFMENPGSAPGSPAKECQQQEIDADSKTLRSITRIKGSTNVIHTEQNWVQDRNRVREQSQREQHIFASASSGAVAYNKFHFRIQDLPEGDTNSRKGCINLLFCKIFAKKLHKVDKFGWREGVNILRLPFVLPLHC